MCWGERNTYSEIHIYKYTFRNAYLYWYYKNISEFILNLSFFKLYTFIDIDQAKKLIFKTIH